MTVATDPWLRESSDPAVIKQAGRNGNALTIWHRDPDPALVAAVASIPTMALPDDRWSGPLSGLARWLGGLQAQLPSTLHAAFAILADDFMDLGRRFAEPCPASAYTFRLHPLSETMCPRFHTDRGPMRLLCTYSGPGTEWLPESAVDRQALATLGTDNAAIVRDPGAIHSVPNFAVAILCGCDRLGRGGVVHRSPRLPQGATRFTFCITIA